MKVKSFGNLIVVAIALVVFSTSGCDDSDGDGSAAKPGEQHDDSDGHHDKSSPEKHAAHGPKGGHVFTIDSPLYQGEWCKYSDNDKIRIYVLDSDAKNQVAVKAENVTIKPMAGNDDEAFVLEPQNANENGESSVFMLDDPALSLSMSMGVEIQFVVGDKTFTGVVKAHKPLDH